MDKIKEWDKFEKKIKKMVEKSKNATCDSFWRDELCVQFSEKEDVYFNSLTQIVLNPDKLWKDKVCIRFKDIRCYSIGYTTTSKNAVKIVKSFLKEV